MIKKIILIENSSQAKEYLDNIERFREATPIVLTFGAEELLLKKDINFKTEEDYENDEIYQGIFDSSIKSTDLICSYFNIEYEGIKLFPLLYLELFPAIFLAKRHLRLLKKIIKTENPEEIFLFNGPNNDFLLKITESVYSGKININELSAKPNRKTSIISIGGLIQNIYSKMSIKFIKKSDKKIFFSGSKSFFETTIHNLLEDQRNHFFRCHNQLQKSFFVDNKYIPFYEFSEKILFYPVFEEKINYFKKKLENTDLSSKLLIEKEIVPVLKSVLWRTLDSRIKKTAGLVFEITRVIKQNKMDIVLLDNSVNPFEKTMIEVCKKYSIPSLIFQHGVLSMKEGFIPMNGDFVLVWGEHAKKWFIKNKIDKKKIVITGSPRHDSFMKKENPNLTNSKYIVYIIDATNYESTIPDGHLIKKRQKEIFKKIFSVMKKFPDYKLIIKTRNGWEMNALPGIIAKKENFTNIEIIESTDNFKLLNNAQAVIVHQSSMGIEALLLNKPVISISYKDLDKFNIYKEMKSVKLAYNEKELETAIRMSLKKNENDSSEIKKIIKEYFYKTDGKSSQRAAEFIKEILNKNLL